MAGRPPKYNPERVAIICRAIADGYTNDAACKMAGIDTQTFYRWVTEKSEFSDAVKRAKADYEEWRRNGILEDAEKSLKTLLNGIEYEEVKTEFKPDPKDPEKRIIIKQTSTTKRIPPNATAAIFALSNRDPENWKNRVENTLAGKVDIEKKPTFSLKNVPDDLLNKICDAINGSE